MIAIIAVNNLGFIGRNNELMWRCSEDLRHFKKMTEGKVMLVGHNTFQTLPEVVKNRPITVDLRGPALDYENMLNQPSINSYICIGGKKTYEKYCHLFTELHISHINDNQIGDCTFPNFSRLSSDCKIFNYHFEVNDNVSEYEELKKELEQKSLLLSETQDTIVDVIKDSIKGGGTTLLIFKQKLEEILRRTVPKLDQKSFDKLVKRYQKNPFEQLADDKKKINKAIRENESLKDIQGIKFHSME